MVGELRLTHFLVMVPVETKHLFQLRILTIFLRKHCEYVHCLAELQSTWMCFVPWSFPGDWRWRRTQTQWLHQKQARGRVTHSQSSGKYMLKIQSGANTSVMCHQTYPAGSMTRYQYCQSHSRTLESRSTVQVERKQDSKRLWIIS